MRYLLFLFLLLLIGCGPRMETEKNYQKETLQLKAIMADDHPSKELLTHLKSLVFFDGEWFATDLESSLALRIGPSMENHGRIGGEGHGPGEFKFPGGIDVDPVSRKIVIYGGDYRFNIFDSTGDYLNQFSIQSGMIERFAAFHESVYVSIPSQESIITHYDFDGNLLSRFGEPIPFPNPRTQQARNAFHLRVVEREGEMQLLAVGSVEPVVKLFTLEGEHLKTTRLDQNKYVRTNLELIDEKIKAEPANKEAVFVMFEDVYAVDDSFYCLLFDHGEDMGANKILEFSLEDFQLKRIITYKAPNGHISFSSIGVTPEGNIIAFESIRDLLLLLKPIPEVSAAGLNQN